MSLTIPDIIIVNTLNYFLSIVRKDYRDNINAGTEERSILYLLFNDLALGKYDLYENIKNIIVTTPQNPKHLEAKLGNDYVSTKVTPAIFLTMPSETDKNNSLSVGQGDNEELSFNNPYPEQDEYRVQYSRRYGTTYYIVILTENRNDMIALYHLIKNGLVACMNYMQFKDSLNRIENIKIGGQDLIFANEIPGGLFKRAITLNFEYEQVVPEIVRKNIYKKLNLYWKVDGAIEREGPIYISSDDSDSES